jgi:hypothetical protein
MPHAGQQFQTELLLLQETSAQGERMRNHRDALKMRLAASAGGAQGGLTLDELEHSVRCMIVGGRFAGHTASFRRRLASVLVGPSRRQEFGSYTHEPHFSTTRHAGHS